MFFAFQKTKKKLSIEEVCSNLCELFPPTPGCDKEGLIGKRIKHKWSVDGSDKWYLETILDVVAGTSDWYNVRYDDEQEVLSLNLLLDIEKGDLKFIDTDFIEF